MTAAQQQQKKKKSSFFSKKRGEKKNREGEREREFAQKNATWYMDRKTSPDSLVCGAAFFFFTATLTIRGKKKLPYQVYFLKTENKKTNTVSFLEVHFIVTMLRNAPPQLNKCRLALPAKLELLSV